jgi:hypothetical protein
MPVILLFKDLFIFLGCYRSINTMSTIPAITRSTGVKIARWSMSEAQAGKSVCDRMAAIIKNKLRYYVNNNHDVIDASQFLQRLKKGESLQGFSIYVSSISEDQDIMAKAPKKFYSRNYNLFGVCICI